MTLITAVIAGLACGYFLGLSRKAVAIFVVVWSVVLIVQTFFMLDKEDVPPEAWSYIPVQIVILAIGAGLLWLGAKLRSRSSRMARAKGQ